MGISMTRMHLREERPTCFREIDRYSDRAVADTYIFIPSPETNGR